MGRDTESFMAGVVFESALCLGVGLTIAGIVETIPPLWIAGITIILVGGVWLGVIIKHSTNNHATCYDRESFVVGMACGFALFLGLGLLSLA